MTEILDKINKILLYELSLNARQSETELAKKIRRSRETVRYRIAQLEKNKIITGYTSWINLSKLSYMSYRVFLKLSSTAEEQQKLIKAIRSHPNVYWVSKADGAWDLHVSFFAKSTIDFFEMEAKFFSDFSNLIIKKTVGSSVEIFVYPEKLFVPSEAKPISTIGKLGDVELDDLDKKVLSILFSNSRSTLVNIAKDTGVSVDIVRHRIKKLEKSGVLISSRAVIDFSKLGYDLYYSLLSFKVFSKDDESQILEFARKHPNVYGLSKIIAPWQVDLLIRAKNHHEYLGIIRELRSRFPNIRNVGTALLSEESSFPSKDTIMEL
ncbi:AsnC family transcriptional regulator [Candidatus Micrarchaeota archaeon]|nr:AsnC family transcriptional regulator [Candidatus Micrarchaeota archaeon]